MQHGIFVAVEQFGQSRRILQGYVRREINLGLTDLARLGRHDDDAVGTADAVNGRRRSVLQHVDRLDLVGIDLVHTPFDTIHDNQRFGIRAVKSRRTANVYVGDVLSGLTAALY